MATAYVLPHYMPPDPFDRPQTRTDPGLTLQDITEAERMLRVNSSTAEAAVDHTVAEIHKRLAQLEDYGPAEFRRISGDHASLITRIDHLLSQVENQNAAIIELSRIIDELKQDGFQPPEPLEDVD